jgi:hypothetical protein
MLPDEQRTRHSDVVREEKEMKRSNSESEQGAENDREPFP